MFIPIILPFSNKLTVRKQTKQASLVTFFGVTPFRCRLGVQQVCSLRSKGCTYLSRVYAMKARPFLLSYRLESHNSFQLWKWRYHEFQSYTSSRSAGSVVSKLMPSAERRVHGPVWNYFQLTLSSWIGAINFSITYSMYLVHTFIILCVEVIHPNLSLLIVWLHGVSNRMPGTGTKTLTSMEQRSLLVELNEGTCSYRHYLTGPSSNRLWSRLILRLLMHHRWSSESYSEVWEYNCCIPITSMDCAVSLLKCNVGVFGFRASRGKLVQVPIYWLPWNKITVNSLPVEFNGRKMPWYELHYLISQFSFSSFWNFSCPFSFFSCH